MSVVGNQKRMRLLITIGILVFSISKTVACSCKEPGTIAEAYHYTETVIHGKVIQKSFVTFESSMSKEKADSLRIKLKGDDQKLGLLESEFIIEVQIEIQKVYKGELVGDTIVLYTSRNGASCGFTRFEVGQDYIIYASSKSHAFWLFNSESSLEKENTLWTNHCTRTTEYNASEAKELDLVMKK